MKLYAAHGCEVEITRKNYVIINRYAKAVRRADSASTRTRGSRILFDATSYARAGVAWASIQWMT
jgi:hypothetical protein